MAGQRSTTPDRPPRPRSPEALAAVVLIAIPLVILAFSRIRLIDDAFITYRYAFNFAAGHGLVFNRGERVEGSTSLLWTILTALPIRLGQPIEYWAPALGLAFAFLACLEIARACRALRLGRASVALALAGLALYPGFWLVATNGMEGGLVAFLVARTLALTIGGHTWRAGVAGGLLFLARPDAIAVLPLCALYALLGAGRTGATSRARWRAALALLAPWGGIVAAATVARLAYYHDWLPNTIAAKSPPHLTAALLGENIREGLRYWAGFFTEATIFGPGVVLAALLAPKRRAVWLVLGIVAVQLPITLINGGDWIPHFRLLAVYAPALTLALALALDRLGALLRAYPRPGRTIARAGVSALLLGSLIPMLSANRWETTPALRINQQGILCTDYQALADAVAPALGADDRIAPEALGLFSYRLATIYSHDFLGLTDRYLARHGTTYWAQLGKSDLGYTYRVAHPTLFVFHSGRGFPDGLRYDAGSTFDSEYAAYTLQALKGCGTNKTIVIIRRDSLDRLLPTLARFAPQPLVFATTP